MTGLLIAPLVLTSYQLPFGAHYLVTNGSFAVARIDSETLHQVRNFLYFERILKMWTRGSKSIFSAK